MNVALKEWSSVVEALRGGKQIFVLRKGGIVEARRGFELRHKEFLFFPTFEHQQTTFLRPEYEDLIQPAPNDEIRISLLGRVAAVLSAPVRIEQLQQARKHHIWTDEFFRQRYGYRPDLPLYIILLRAYRLPREEAIPLRDSYAGCKSWVNLTEEIAVDPVTPVLSDAEFESRRESLLAELT